jgi:hypothetical protein
MAATELLVQAPLHPPCLVTVLQIQDGVVRARIDGCLKMKRTVYPHRNDENFVKATTGGSRAFRPCAW